jgi:hypothetical protein
MAMALVGYIVHASWIVAVEGLRHKETTGHVSNSSPVFYVTRM